MELECLTVPEAARMDQPPECDPQRGLSMVAQTAVMGANGAWVRTPPFVPPQEWEHRIAC